MTEKSGGWARERRLPNNAMSRAPWRTSGQAGRKAKDIYVGAIAADDGGNNMDGRIASKERLGDKMNGTWKHKHRIHTVMDAWLKTSNWKARCQM